MNSYKKIIEKIMGSEAKERGFKIVSGRTLLVTKTIAIFQRTKEGKSQSFYITEDLLREGKLYLDCNCRIEATFDREDEESFQKCIEQFNDYMMTKGYTFLDDQLRQPIFTHDDSEYVKNNYIELAEVFLNSKNIVFFDNNLKNMFDELFRKLEELFDLEWEDAKEGLLSIAACITYVMVRAGYGIQIIDKRNISTFYIERNDEFIKCVSNSPINLVYVAYKIKKLDKVMIPALRKFLTDEEWKERGGIIG
ncbi:hypothetical protein [Ruminococcus sp.]|uniref:hypothetical protein n=1 Tax=Ruminococcus sp. TaxID=41978 RepID=UPI0025F6A724|nr:hypothetical protein [Ruminococcus sp.]